MTKVEKLLEHLIDAVKREAKTKTKRSWSEIYKGRIKGLFKGEIAYNKKDLEALGIHHKYKIEKLTDKLVGRHEEEIFKKNKRIVTLMNELERYKKTPPKEIVYIPVAKAQVRNQK